jgi:hypothetical protein
LNDEEKPLEVMEMGKSSKRKVECKVMDTHIEEILQYYFSFNAIIS